MPSSYALLLTTGTKIKFRTVLLLHYGAKMIDRRFRFKLSAYCAEYKCFCIDNVTLTLKNKLTE